MLEPIIGFSIFITIMSLIIYNVNRNRQKQYDDIKDKLDGRTNLFIEQTKSSTITWGLNNNNYLFNKCDIYLTNDSLIILGYTKNSILKQLSIPIILTNQIADYSSDFPYAYVKKINSFGYENNLIKIKFGEIGIFKTEVTIKLTKLTEEEKASMIELSKKNSW
jgi:hypothetical protein